MADNRFTNSDRDFEDIFSNSSSDNQFEDIYSNSADQHKYEDISSFSDNNDVKSSHKSYEDYFNDDFTVKYNSAVQNRRRQEISYEDVSQVFESISSENEPRKRKKKRHPVRNTFIILLCLVIAGVSCLGFYGYQTVDKILSSFNTDEPLQENQYIDSSELYSDPNQTNILLIGIDARKADDDSRSDTMMLLTIDNTNGQIKLTSFLRDSYVEIAGKNWNEKLNAAYFRGGVQMLVDTLELNFKVDIPYYMLVNFEIFTTIVDELGGITVDVTERESEYVKTSKKPNIPVEIPAGEDVLLNGEQALWYARIRKLDSDFMRTKRQRKVITAMVEKALQTEIGDLITLAETVAPLVKTNLTSDQIFDLGLGALKDKAYSYDIVQHQVPADGTWSSRNISNVGSSLVMDMDENIELLHSFLSEKQEVEKKEEPSKTTE